MASENVHTPPRAEDLLLCWRSGQIAEADMIERLRGDDLLRRRMEHLLGRQLVV